MPGFVTVAQTSEIPPGTMKEVDLDGESVVVVNVAGQYYAIEGVCTHQGGPLGEGQLKDCVVTCPWHSAAFDVRSGDAVHLPATDALAPYRVRVSGTEIQIAAT
ncbi:MAG: non-heme iron oxygenase ferredoxin subunit [Chloroflexota bacterium]